MHGKNARGGTRQLKEHWRERHRGSLPRTRRRRLHGSVRVVVCLATRGRTGARLDRVVASVQKGEPMGARLVAPRVAGLRPRGAPVQDGGPRRGSCGGGVDHGSCKAMLPRIKDSPRIWMLLSALGVRSKN